MKPLKILTYNLRCETPHDREQAFFFRKDYCVERILYEKPDLIGFQEALPHMHAFLADRLSAEYDLIGYGRNADFTGESNPIAIRRGSVTLTSYSQFWLSPTPSVPGSRFEIQSNCPRICVKAEFLTPDGIPFRYWNTHLDHVSPEARKAGAELILSELAKEDALGKLPFFLSGDFNDTPDSLPLRAFLENGAHPLADLTNGVGGTFHAYGTREHPEQIDYILGSAGTAFRDAHRLTGRKNGMFLSDHDPVTVTVTAFPGALN